MLGAITGLFSLFSGAASSISKGIGVDEGIVTKVIKGIEHYASKDERVQKFWAEQMQNARKHDIATFDKTDVFSNRLRSAVRPFCTMVALLWYVYARSNEIPLGQEDYAIVGGILAFWFGFRPFEKRKK